MRGVRILATVVAAAGLAVSADDGLGKTPPPPRPDLELAKATFQPRVLFKGEPRSQARFCVTVENHGTRRSGRIVATMTLKGPGVDLPIAERSLAPLRRPTRPRRGAPPEVDSVSGCEQGDAGALLAPLGAYDVEICVRERSGRERRLADNCRARAKRAFVVKRVWNATLSGQAGLGVLELGFERWQSNAMTFTFDPAQQRVDQGHFTYNLSAGSVTYNDQENATGCQRIGTLTDFSPTGRLSLDLLKGTYESVGRTHAGFTYPINSLCDDLQGPVMPVFVDTGIGVAPQAMPFGTEVLAGSRGGPLDQQTYTWVFN